MEGVLQQVQTGILFGGSKTVYCLILGSEFLVYKGTDKASKEMVRVELKTAEVQLQEKAFVIYDAKKKKMTFKAGNPEDTKLWVLSINKFTNNLSEDIFKEEESDDSDYLTQNLKQRRRQQPGSTENLFEAFHSRLFVDECDLNVKIKTLNEIQELFKQEKKALEGIILDEEKYNPIKKQVQSISNLSNTIDRLITNLIEEVDDSRSHMFDILEEIALEQAKHEYEKKKSKKVKKKSKKNAQVSASFIEKNNKKLGSRVNKDVTGSMNVGRSKSNTVSGQGDDFTVNGRFISKGGMEFDEENKDGDLRLVSKNSDSSSSILNMDETMLDDEDDFEDAEEGVTISHDKQMKRIKNVIISDCEEERIALPCLRDSKIKTSTIWTILKDMIGKDITKYSMPVIVNEPISILQKAAEPLQFNYLLAQAALEDDPLMRLVYVSLFQASRNFNLVGRVTKPFNPLLGETFEVVTPTYRALAEQVSHHPPITALACQGDGYAWTKTNEIQLKFTGKAIQAWEENSVFIKLYPNCKKKDAEPCEHYTFTPNKTYVGNLIIGETYIEPQGISTVINHSTGDKAEVDYKIRGWSGKNKEEVHGVIKNSLGEPKYHIFGKYSEKFILKNLETEEEKEIWTAPSYPENHVLMYGMSSFSLQLNLITDKLREKLPPTDVRLRQDMRAWESGLQQVASDLKHKLEENQRNRKKILKKELGDVVNGSKDSEYYTPLYFKQAKHPLNDEPYYEFVEKNKRGSNYWQDREKGDWKHLPKIWEDDCQPFY